MKLLIAVIVGATMGAVLNNVLGVHIEPMWKAVAHTLYYMGLGIVLWECA